jgi:hypothetical protein
MKNSINLQLKISLGIYVTFLILTVLPSIAYIFRSEFMPYHAAAIGMNWSELSPGIQNVITGLMKALGAGWLSVAIAMGILLYKPFRNGEIWSYWAVFLIPLPSDLINMYVAYNMMTQTPAVPPWQIVVFKTVLLLLAFILSISAKENSGVSVNDG